ncbi:hypothetical protein PLUTE_a3507 [Pseudoalteromonas luteoviolacea DSM 6061]|nr:hypothetical protein [Pseudoalteromonas luteoviolacea DSM 6061]
MPNNSRSYTGHEPITLGGDNRIIHMNGRIYDADTGRFMQADPFVQAPSNLQNYNAYSYVLNNPLSYTDPSGYFFKKLAGTLLSRKGAQMIGFSLGGLTGAWLGGRAYDRIMGSEGLQTVVAVALNFVPGCQVWCSALFSAQVNYYHTGNVGSALRAGTTSAAIAGVFYGIGQGAVALDAVGSPLHISAHAVAGGIIADVQGGNFGHGFWSAGLTKAVNVNSFMPGDGTLMDIARTIVAGAIGGTISQLTGGKFANGAITAAYAQAYNGNNELKKAAKTPQQSHASGEYATDNGGQIKYLQSSDVAGVTSLSDADGNTYYVNGESGIAELAYSADNGVATSVCPECYVGVARFVQLLFRGSTTTVTSWAGAGQTPDLMSGRWVMVGGPTLWNYFRTMLWGPQIRNGRLIIRGYKQNPMNNYISRPVHRSRVTWPRGVEKWRGAFGQRQIK